MLETTLGISCERKVDASRYYVRLRLFRYPCRQIVQWLSIA